MAPVIARALSQRGHPLSQRSSRPPLRCRQIQIGYNLRARSELNRRLAGTDRAGGIANSKVIGSRPDGGDISFLLALQCTPGPRFTRKPCWRKKSHFRSCESHLACAAGGSPPSALAASPGLASAPMSGVACWGRALLALNVCVGSIVCPDVAQTFMAALQQQLPDAEVDLAAAVRAAPPPRAHATVAALARPSHALLRAGALRLRRGFHAQHVVISAHPVQRSGRARGAPRSSPLGAHARYRCGQRLARVRGARRRQIQWPKRHTALRLRRTHRGLLYSAACITSCADAPYMALSVLTTLTLDTASIADSSDLCRCSISQRWRHQSWNSRKSTVSARCG